MKLFLSVFLALSLFCLPSFAQDKKCDGPAQLCQQIADLQAQVQVQKDMKDQAALKEHADLAAAKAANDAAEEERMKKVIAAAALMAVVLKLLVSSLKSWKGFFKTDKQKAGLKIALVGLSVAIFLVTNMSYGIPWWQALILAGGGPASIAVHEILKLFEVLSGKKTYEQAEQEEAQEEAAQAADQDK